MLNIINGTQYSFRQIVDWHAAGASVMRTTHLGNQPPELLLCSSHGIPIALDESLYGNAKTYKPAYLKQDGRFIKLVRSNDEQLRLFQIDYLKYEAIPVETVRLLEGKANTICQLHLESLRQVHGRNAFAVSELYFTDEGFLHDVLSVFAQEMPTVFSEYYVDGVLHFLSEAIGDYFTYVSKNGLSVQAVRRSDIAGLCIKFIRGTLFLCEGVPLKVSGIRINVKLMALLISVIDGIRINGGRKCGATLIHLAGIHMMNYMFNDQTLSKDYQMNFRMVYSVLQKKFSNVFATDCNFIVFPVNSLYPFLHWDNDLLEDDFHSARRDGFAPSGPRSERSHYDQLVSPSAVSISQNLFNMKICDLM